MKYLVDTNIFIYHFNKDSLATHFLENNAGEYAISFVTFIELLGFPDIDDSMTESIRDFLGNISVRGMSDEIVEMCIKNRKDKKIKLADNIIASTAQVYDLILVTRNIDDFRGLKLNTYNPYEI
jgi:predicted nucleic acid-binding protein